jgi:hypothetical protein
MDILVHGWGDGNLFTYAEDFKVITSSTISTLQITGGPKTTQFIVN